MHHQIQLGCSNYGGQDVQDEKCTKKYRWYTWWEYNTQEAQVQTGNNIKMDLKETGCDRMNWIQLTTGLVAGSCIVSHENLDFTRVGNFLIRWLIISFSRCAYSKDNEWYHTQCTRENKLLLKDTGQGCKGQWNNFVHVAISILHIHIHTHKHTITYKILCTQGFNTTNTKACH